MFSLYFALVVQATLMTHFFLCQKTPLSQSFSNLHGPPTKVPNLVTLEASHSYASRNLLLRPVEQGRVNESITCSKCCANSFATLATFQITTTKAHLGHQHPISQAHRTACGGDSSEKDMPISVTSTTATQQKSGLHQADWRQRSSRPDSPDLFKYVSQLPEDGHQICGMFLDFTVPYIHPKIAKKKKRHNTRYVSMHVSICPKFLNGQIDLMRRFQGLRCPYPKKDTSL